jgi:hypothetical protein
MGAVLIRGLSEAAVARVDADAATPASHARSTCAQADEREGTVGRAQRSMTIRG